jgi:hypothetical protein
MAQTYFPFDSGAGANVTEAQWSKMAQNWLSTGVIKSYNNELSVYADSTGMQAKIKTGAAWIKGHYFESDAEEVLAIGTSNNTNPRIDRVIVRLDWTTNTIQLAVLQGTPAASPTAPALTQNSSRWEISLAQVYIGANVSTIAVGNITDERTVIVNRNDIAGYLKYINGQDKYGLNANTWTTLLWSNPNDYIMGAKGMYLSGNSLIFTKKGIYLFTIDTALSGLNVGNNIQLRYYLRDSSDVVKYDDQQYVTTGSHTDYSNNQEYQQAHLSNMMLCDIGDKLDIQISCSEGPRTIRWVRINAIESGSY